MFGLKIKSGSEQLVLPQTANTFYPKSVPMPKPCEPLICLDEYEVLAKELGFIPPDMKIEAFKEFLRARDIPVFNLHEVIVYMDKKAKDESKHQCGWEWRPLRAVDANVMLGAEFGNPCSESNRSSFQNSVKTPSSDYYKGPVDVPEQRPNGFYSMVIPAHRAVGSSLPYDRTIPVHALRKISLIEKSSFKGDVAFMVNDYALMPHITNPDPFLLVVIPNPKLDRGIGRFVIDFWDEPGFGIEQMIR